MTLVDKGISWFRRLPKIVRAMLYAAASALMTVGFAPAVEPPVQDLIEQPSWLGAGIVLVIFVGAAAFVFLPIGLVAVRADTLDREYEHKNAVMMYAASLVDQEVSAEVAHIAKKNKLTLQNALREHVDRLITAVHQLFESQFARAERAAERIEFEVTFMTKASDDHLTIGAWCNRTGREPPSLRMRKKDIRIYDKTVAAQVYRDPSVAIRIVEDTDADASYAELYANQKSRIKSSIVYGVLSPSNEVLGVLVVHCDRSLFFRKGEIKWWAQLLEIFGRRLALAVVRQARFHDERTRGTSGKATGG